MSAHLYPGQRVFCSGQRGLVFTIGAVYGIRASITADDRNYLFVFQASLRPAVRSLRLVAVDGAHVERAAISNVEARA